MSAAPSAYRNIAFVGHPSSGKTTLVDTMAHHLGASERKGSVADKTSICDTEHEEQEKGHTLSAKVVHAEKGGRVWNLMDTPGYPDFMAETISSIFAADLVVGVVSCSSGVTYNLRTKLGQASLQERGRAIVVTHVDGENADFDAVVESLRAEVGEVCVPCQVPDASGSGFSAVTDVATATDSPWRKRLFDRVMDACEDEDLLMEYLESESLSEEQLAKLLPVAIEAGTIVPILVCNPASDLGVQGVIEFLDHYGPGAEGARFRVGDEAFETVPEGDLFGVVVSVRSDPHVGRICTARILRGTLDAHDLLTPADGGKGEKIGGLFHLVGGKKRDALEKATAGDIIAFTKVESVSSGGTFVRAGSEATALIPPRVPVPMVSLAVFPKSRADEQKIGEALHKLEAEDPTFKIEHVAATHEMVMHGMSDLHLQIMESRLKRRFGVEIETKLPRIAYQETVTRSSEGHHRHKKQTGGRGQFGECYIRMRPGEKGTGFVFVDKVVGGSIPRNLIPAIEKGMREICNEGVLTHSHVVDVEAEVYDGKFHAVDSDEASFKKAGAWAFRDAFQKAKPVLLEPIIAAEIHVPTEDAGTIFSDITSQRRGHVTDQESDGSITIIKAHVPLATMQTYFRDLKSQTAGEGTYAMELDHYAAVPANEQQKILAEIGRKHSEDD